MITYGAPPSVVLFGEGNDRRCGRCNLKTNPTIPESAWDGRCSLCRAGKPSTYPAAITSRMADPTWESRMKRLVAFEQERGYGDVPRLV